MATLLNTSALPAADRHDAFRDAMLAASGATHVELEPPHGLVTGQMQLHSLGDTRIFMARSSGIAMKRDNRTARGASPEAVAIAVQGLGAGRHQEGERQRLVRPGELMVVDITRPFDFSWSGMGSSTSLQVSITDLGMPLSAVQKAAGRLESSPVYGIVSRFLVELARDAARLSLSPAAPALDRASVALIQALLSSVGVDPGRSREVLERTLLTQIQAYVRENLCDPQLNADEVASALSVSRRQVFRACTKAELSFEQYVIARRLEGAKAALANPSNRSWSIAGIAYAWGFKDPTHFTRRFSAAYGMRPKDWANHVAEESTPGRED